MPAFAPIDSPFASLAGEVAVLVGDVRAKVLVILVVLVVGITVDMEDVEELVVDEEAEVYRILKGGLSQDTELVPL